MGDGRKKKMEDSETRPFGGCRRFGRLLDSGSFFLICCGGNQQTCLTCRDEHKIDFRWLPSWIGCLTMARSFLDTKMLGEDKVEISM